MKPLSSSPEPDSKQNFAKSDPSPALATGMPHTILAVDDEPIILKTVQSLATVAGYQIVLSNNPKEALQLAREQKFAVILSDHHMPEMMGADFLREVAQIQPNASRILMTGVRSLEVVVSAVNTGEIFRFVTKPWVRAEMLATLHNAVQRFELVEETERLEKTTRELNDRLAIANHQLEEQLEELRIQKQQIDESHAALKKNFDRSLELCHRILHTFNPVLGEQAKAAAMLCQRMAESEYFTEEERHVLVVSAWLHDIGLAGMPRGMTRSVLSDPKNLTSDIQQLVKDHTIYGQTLASFVDSLTSVGETIRAHHERFDGKGYPDHLAGEMIPWTARCLAIVVYYVACGRPHNEAIEDILNQSGTAFDPEAIRLFLRTTHARPMPRQIREVMLDELTAGMQLASGIYSPTGILLIPEGQELDAATISKLRNHSRLSSLPQQLLVYR